MVQTFAGHLLLREGVVDGWVQVEAGRLVEWGEDEPPAPPDATGWVVPGLVNAHTHVADAFLRDVRGKPQSVPELVGPGGWKHRQLAMARKERAARGVVRYAAEMAASGTGHFIDFRENGRRGVRFLNDLRDGADWVRAEGLDPLAASPVALGRPSLNDFDEDEAEELLEMADGIGLSGMRDFHDPRDIEAWADAAHKAGRPFSIHVSEDKHDDIDAVAALDPDFVVHMCHASPRDVQMMGDTQTPIVVCPRSNRFFGQRPPMQAIMAYDVPFAFGTDNGMLQDGDLLQELALVATMDGIPVDRLLRAASYGGRDLLGLPDPWTDGIADLVVLPEDPLRGPAIKPGFEVPV